MVAKSVGITVHEFALGMGPKLFSFQRGETCYSLRLVPIGGFTQMEGEDFESSSEGSFGKKKVWQRILVVGAGAAMNILLGFFILLGLSIGEDGLSSTTIARFSEEAVSSQMLMEGDRITHVNGARVHIGNDLIFELLRDSDGVIDFTVVRDGQKVQLKGVQFDTAKSQDGTNLITLDFKVFAIEKTPGNVLSYAWYWTMGTAREVWVSLIDLITGKYGLSQLSGPVGVTSVIGQAAGMGLSTVLSLLALITINIGIFNLLPVPALDGGRLVFLLIELIFRRRVPAKYEAYVHAAGLIALFGLMAVVTISDISRLF